MSPPRQFGTESPMLAMGERALISPTCSMLVFRPSSKTQRVGLDRLTVVIKIRLEWVLRGWTGKLHNRNWEGNIVTAEESKARTACVVDYLMSDSLGCVPEICRWKGWKLLWTASCCVRITPYCRMPLQHGKTFRRRLSGSKVSLVIYFFLSFIAEECNCNIDRIYSSCDF